MTTIINLTPAGHRARGFVRAFFPLAAASVRPSGDIRVHDGAWRWIGPGEADGSAAWIAAERLVRAMLAGEATPDDGPPASTPDRGGQLPRGGPATDESTVRQVREMKARGVLQKDIAARLGISEAAVSRIVRGKRRSGVRPAD
jgi:hypothetical protein